ncbi:MULTISPECIES: V0D/AC39 family V-type ATPase subunit [Lachnospiraceae]|uniref:V0D/AC39 family V-type ATPase subunit n=1 Tax=Lachnospiraceae TaxID=186803 RepID=UPI001F2A2AEB|nr:V-type ATPase subunit [Faecalicatena contorta]MCI6121436.1 V-type ATPase subunit [Lachnospiraceae bacterium]MCF2667498.1 V-type ATPase subunit [Faecalicatena contorta]MCI6533182.1 V-type ATPase subunit [Lachnospiraceae bacterium]MDY2613278.1 V-type ATPase subunit [Lachnospiraceae bacterium]MDY4207914.1 V-type ATPase subunit [Lachnospiraceae bacterium]
MGNVMSYSGIVTKVRAMQAKLLTEKDFENIANLKSVPEAIDYLKEKPAYADYVNRMDVSLYHRGNVEKVLYQSLFDDYTRIFRFAGMEQKKFLKIYWKRYEIDLINYCLRIIFNHYDKPFDLEYKKEFFDKYSQISIDKLITSRNIVELVDNLRGTEYYAPLQKLRDAEDANLFDYDLALDLYYFSSMWKKNKRLLKGKELELYTRDCGTKIDLLNIQWIYRAKKYYHMLPPDIYSLTIPIHYRISVEEFKMLVEAPTLEEFERQLGTTYYAKKLVGFEGKKLEHIYKECLKRLYLSDRRKNPYSIATVNTYLFLKEEEIYKLTTALECIRYGLSSRETLGYLGGVIE